VSASLFAGDECRSRTEEWVDDDVAAFGHIEQRILQRFGGANVTTECRSAIALLRTFVFTGAPVTWGSFDTCRELTNIRFAKFPLIFPDKREFASRDASSAGRCSRRRHLVARITSDISHEMPIEEQSNLVAPSARPHH
jgi:hypothetical protein